MYKSKTEEAAYCIERHEFDKALALLKEAEMGIDLTEINKFYIHLYRGEAFLGLLKPANAVEEYLNCLKLANQFQNPIEKERYEILSRIWLGNAYSALGDYSKSIEQYDLVKPTKNSPLGALLQKAILFVKMKNIEGAEKILNEIIDITHTWKNHKTWEFIVQEQRKSLENAK